MKSGEKTNQYFCSLQKSHWRLLLSLEVYFSLPPQSGHCCGSPGDPELPPGSTNVVPRLSREKLCSRTSCGFAVEKIQEKTKIARGLNSVPSEIHDIKFSPAVFSSPWYKTKPPGFLTGGPGGPGGPAVPGGPGGPCKRGNKCNLSNPLVAAESLRSSPVL